MLVEPRIIPKFQTSSGIGRPRWHLAGRYLLLDGLRAGTHLFVRRQRYSGRQFTFPMTLYAAPPQNWRDVFRERWRLIGCGLDIRRVEHDLHRRGDDPYRHAKEATAHFVIREFHLGFQSQDNLSWILRLCV